MSSELTQQIAAGFRGDIVPTPDTITHWLLGLSNAHDSLADRLEEVERRFGVVAEIALDKEEQHQLNESRRPTPADPGAAKKLCCCGHDEDSHDGTPETGFGLCNECVCVQFSELPKGGFATVNSTPSPGAWSAEVPTRPGWHWWRQDSGDRKKPIEVWADVRLCGDEGQYTSEIGGEWWSTPIPAPGTPAAPPAEPTFVQDLIADLRRQRDRWKEQAFRHNANECPYCKASAAPPVDGQDAAGLVDEILAAWKEHWSTDSHAGRKLRDKVAAYRARLTTGRVYDEQTLIAAASAIEDEVQECIRNNTVGEEGLETAACIVRSKIGQPLPPAATEVK